MSNASRLPVGFGRRRPHAVGQLISMTAAVAVSLAGCRTTFNGGTAGGEAPVPSLQTGVHEAVIGGVRHWYRVAGECAGGKPPVLFLHGGPGEGSDRFSTFAGPRLEDSLCMIYFDQRGSGRSDRAADGNYGIPTLTADIEGLRRTLGVPSMAIVAHSFGVLLALEYAASHAQHVSRMVLAGGVWDIPAALDAQCERLRELNPRAYARAAAAAAGSEPSCDLFRALSGPEMEAFFEANMFPDRRTLTLLASVDSASDYQHKGEMGRALFAGGLLTYRFTKHDRVSMPVLVIAGQEDHQGGTLHRDLVRLLPRARLHEYEETGHFMYIERPERFARDVVSFMNEGMP